MLTLKYRGGATTSEDISAITECMRLLVNAGADVNIHDKVCTPGRSKELTQR